MSFLHTLASLATQARQTAGTWNKVQGQAGRAGRAWREVQDDLVQRDYDRAMAGNAQAQFEMGERFYQGLGVEREYASAAGWFALAARQGHGEAQRLLAMLYFLGRGVDADPAEAYKWIHLAVAQGAPKAIDIQRKILAKIPPEAVAEGERRAASVVPPSSPPSPSAPV